jgi:hypothetical protein
MFWINVYTLYKLWNTSRIIKLNCAPDDGRGNARNMLSCKKLQDNKLENFCGG